VGRELSVGTVMVLHALARGHRYGFDVIEATGLAYSNSVSPYTVHLLTRVDGEPVEPDWVFHEDAESGLRGLLAYLDVSALSPGRHDLLVARVAGEDGDRLDREAADGEAGAEGRALALADRDRYGFPFWIPGPTTGAWGSRESAGQASAPPQDLGGSR